jgi:hypothetical protein
MKTRLFALSLSLSLSLAPLARAQIPVSDLNVQRTVRLGTYSTGTITPAQITADQNNYAPTGYAAAFRMRLSSDAARNLTGLAATAGGGGTMVLVNVGSFAITLKDESASSTAANRFALSGDYVLAADTAAWLEYDTTSTRWRLVGTMPASLTGSFALLGAVTGSGLTIATDRLAGRDSASTGAIEEITVGGGIEFTGSGGIQRSALTGDVTATAGSNATTIAANAVALGTDTTGNYVATIADAGSSRITVANSGAENAAVTLDITNDAVSFAKMQNITSDRLIGRDTASSGDPEEISVSGGLEWTGTGGIQRSALTGDVTASAGSNATTIAANAVALGTDTTGNYVATIADAGSSRITVANSGAENAAVTLDITNDAVSFAKMQNITSDRLIGRDTAASGDPEEIALSTGLEWTGTGSIRVTSNLRALDGLTSAADKLPYFTGSGTAAVADFTAGGRALVNSAGTANTFPYFSGSNTVTLASITAAGRALLDDVDAAAQRTTLGLGSTNAVTFQTIQTGVGVSTIGAGGAIGQGELSIDGGSDNDYGARLYFKRGGTASWQLGHSSSILGGSSSDLVLHRNGVATIATFSSTGVAVTGSGSFTNGLTITGSPNAFDAFSIEQSSSNALGLRIRNTYAGSNYWNISSSGGGPAANGSLVVYDDTGGAVAMTIAKTTRAAAFTSSLGASGNVWSGNNDFSVNSGTTDGWYVGANGEGVQSINGNVAQYYRRRSSDGEIVRFYRDTTQVGSISVTTTATAFNTSSGEDEKILRAQADAARLAAAAAAIEAIPLYDYNWKADGAPGFGPTAEALQRAVKAVAPAAVTAGDDYDWQQVHDRSVRRNARAARNEARRAEHEAATAAHAAEMNARLEAATAAEVARRERLGPAKLLLLDQRVRQAKLVASVTPGMRTGQEARNVEAAEAELQRLDAEVGKIPLADRTPIVAAELPAPAAPVLEHDPEDDIPDPKKWGVDYSKLVPLLIAHAQVQSQRITALEQERRVAQFSDWTAAAALIATGYLLRRRWAA